MKISLVVEIDMDHEDFDKSLTIDDLLNEAREEFSFVDINGGMSVTSTHVELIG